jgi:ABC-type uncharacterized transport system substrate-binding protein
MLYHLKNNSQHAMGGYGENSSQEKPRGGRHMRRNQLIWAAPMHFPKPRALAALALMSISLHAVAHPHVWIDYSATAQMTGSKITAIRETWTFTKTYPFSLVGDFSDAPTSGPMDAKHTALIYKQAFSNLRTVNYFTHVFANGKEAPVGEARDFAVAVEDKHMVYRFLVPLNKPVDVKASKVTVGIWDDSFFVDFNARGPQPVTLDETAARTCSATRFDDRDHPIFSGMVTPIASKISC